MTSIEIPDPLWEMNVEPRYDQADWRVTIGYYASLRFMGNEVYALLYDELNNADIFHDALHGRDVERIQDAFGEAVAYKLSRMFISFGGPI